MAASKQTKTAGARRRSPLQRALKALEQGIKGGLLAVLTRLAAPRAAGAPAWNGGTVRVLFLRHDKIGDMILSTGIIRAIANAHPEIELDVLASFSNAAVIEKEPLVHRVWRFDIRRVAGYWKLLRELRQARYHIVVDCMVFKQSLTTMLLMLASGAPHRAGVLKPGKPNIYTMGAQPAAAGAHHVEHLAQLALPFEVAAQEAMRLQIVLSEAERAAALTRWSAGKNRRVLLNISVGKSFRQWPDQHFIAVARHLKALLPTARILILHAPGEGERAASIADAAGVARADTPGVRDALALVATAELAVTPDTSIVHAASAFGIPTVAMTTAGHAVRWGLYGTVGEVAIAPGDTLASLPLDQVLQAIDRVAAKIFPPEDVEAEPGDRQAGRTAARRAFE